MKSIDIIADLYTEYGHDPIINRRSNYITINFKHSGVLTTFDRWFIVTIINNTVAIRQVLIGPNKPSVVEVIKTDLRDPHSIDIIRKWLKDPLVKIKTRLT